MAIEQEGQWKVGDVFSVSKAKIGNTFRKNVETTLYTVVTDPARLQEDLNLAQRLSSSLPGGLRGTQLMTEEQYQDYLAQQKVGQ
jgi:hypothetical protein